MGHHINGKGQFQSDKYPYLAPDKIVLSFKDPHARKVLLRYAKLSKDLELSEDICTRITSIEREV